MRNEALLALVLTLGALTSPGLAAEDLTLTGKPAEWEIRGEKPKELPTIAPSGEGLETPNQKRRRLGLTMETSAPIQDYGVAEETPNHRRQRQAQAALLAKAQ